MRPTPAQQRRLGSIARVFCPIPDSPDITSARLTCAERRYRAELSGEVWWRPAIRRPRRAASPTNWPGPPGQPRRRPPEARQAARARAEELRRRIAQADAGRCGRRQWPGDEAEKPVAADSFVTTSAAPPSALPVVAVSAAAIADRGVACRDRLHGLAASAVRPGTAQRRRVRRRAPDVINLMSIDYATAPGQCAAGTDGLTGRFRTILTRPRTISSRRCRTRKSSPWRRWSTMGGGVHDRRPAVVLVSATSRGGRPESPLGPAGAATVAAVVTLERVDGQIKMSGRRLRLMTTAQTAGSRSGVDLPRPSAFTTA